MDTLKELEKISRKAWLAGIGAYGTSWDYAVEKFDETYAKTNEVINDLVLEGEKIEKDLQEKIKSNIEIEAKVEELKIKLGLSNLSEVDKIEAVSDKVDKLTVKVEKLVKSRKAKVKPMVKKAVAKKPVVKKAVVKKTVAKQPVAKKPVVKKTVAQKPVAKKPVV